MENEKNKEQEEYEKRLRRRLEILKKEMEAGKVHLPNDAQIKNSLLSIKYDSNGQIDLNTVDGIVRSMALGIEAMHDREELKNSISLKEIQNTYFNFIEDNFGEYFKIMQEKKLTPHQAAIALTRSQEGIEAFSKPIPDFLEAISDFWLDANEPTSIHIEDSFNTLKGVFGGDLFPSNEESIASKCGLYTDTIILPDPFIRTKDLFPRWDQKDRAYYLLKHAMNLLQYKDLACSDLDLPIIVILADKFLVDDYERKYITKMGEEDALYHAYKLFNRKFESFQEFMDFTKSLDTIDKIKNEVKSPEKILFDTEWGNTLEEQLKRASESQSKLIGTSNPGIILSTMAMGRMGVSNEILFKANRLKSTPLIDAPTSWKYFNWKLEYDAERYKEDKSQLGNLHILKGLQDLKEGEMQWLGKIPHSALIEIRKEGALEEIRHIINKGIEELISIDANDFDTTSKKIFDNIYESFENHQKSINELKSKKWKFAGKDIGTWLVVGTLEVAAAATGLPLWGLGGIAANQLLDAPKIKDIPKSFQKLLEESKKIKRSPVGLLFKYKDK